MIKNPLSGKSAALLGVLVSLAAASSSAAPTATAAATLPRATVLAAAAPACPVVEDKLYAAVVRPVPLEKITPEPVFRKDCKTLYRADGRAPDSIFKEGFRPRDTVNGQYDLEKYVLANQPSPFVSTTYDHDLYKTWAKWLKPGAYNYYIDAPNGIDVNRTIGDTHKYADQVEVAFPGGVASRFIIGACPIDKQTRTEIMSGCESNPAYQPATTQVIPSAG
ncbi:ADP-ribosyltransferase [Streptomyces sp. NPDC050145]|uniref:ADP-ribosyltransferase n=1 Tax=Streptomyces sp. NPDC050145 TaxID=3365602 RepID=UPI0037AB2820